MRTLAMTIAVMTLVACGGSSVHKRTKSTSASASDVHPAHGTTTKSPPKIHPRSKTESTAKIPPEKVRVAASISYPVKPKKPLLPPMAKALTIAAVGDIMLGSTFPRGKRLPPHDGSRVLEGVKKTLSAADVTFGNLEGPMIDGGRSAKCARMRKRPGKRKTCYAFRMPTRYGQYLADAGFDMLSLSNNHAMDFGLQGRESTKSCLTKLGIAHASAPGTIAERTVKGVKVGMLAFATAWHSHDLRKIDDAVKVVKAAAARYQILMVSFHGGAEGRRAQRVPHGTEYYLRENRGDLRKFARAVIDAGADLVIGHGPHVVRGMEVYKDRLIAYSLGNFATHSFIMSGQYGIAYILEAKVSNEGKFISGVIRPTKQSQVKGTTPDPRGRVIPVLRRLSNADFGASAVTIENDGRFTAAKPSP